MSGLDYRLNSMTFWYPMLAWLQYRTHNPLPRIVPSLSGPHGLTVEPAEDDGFRLQLPETIIIHYPYSHEIGNGEPARGWEELCTGIDGAATRLGGYPVFLRTEASSDKHSWKDTCYLPGAQDIGRHVWNLVEHALMHDLPCDFFAVRRLIATRPVCTAFYGKMPVARERRVFISDGAVACHHPYWPADAFQDDHVTGDQIRELQDLPDADERVVMRMAAFVATHIPGSWSVDFLQDADGGWWCIDMAVSASSYHWPDCEGSARART